MNIARRVDFHTHILPNIDDGSKSLEESMDMLREESRQGIDLLFLTPHFYPTQMNVEQFIILREKMLQRLQKAIKENSIDSQGKVESFPEMILGAEIYYFEGISRTDALSGLHLGNSEYMLLEMPVSKWTDRMIRDVIELHQRPDTKVILAHIERYLKYQSSEVWDILLDYGVLMQVNASFFLNRLTRRKAFSLLKRDCIHVLGSDCHNMGERAPRLGTAMELIRDKDNDWWKRLCDRQEKLVEVIKGR